MHLSTVLVDLLGDFQVLLPHVPNRLRFEFVGFGIQVLGLRVSGSGFRAEGLGVLDLGFRCWGFGFRVEVSSFKIEGRGTSSTCLCRVKGLEFSFGVRVQVSGFRF